MKYILQLFINAIAVVIIAKILPGVMVDSMSTALWVAFALSVLNLLIKPLLILFTLPITILTLGFFLLIINAIIINLAAYFVSGFSVSSIWVALFFSLLLSFTSSILSSLLGVKKEED